MDDKTKLTTELALKRAQTNFSRQILKARGDIFIGLWRGGISK